jgi:hypothetical protein
MLSHVALTEKIQHYVEKLPESDQAEVLVYVKSLSARKKKPMADRVEESWDEFSLNSAMRGMEDEKGPKYSAADLKIVFS